MKKHRNKLIILSAVILLAIGGILWNTHSTEKQTPDEKPTITEKVPAPKQEKQIVQQKETTAEKTDTTPEAPKDVKTEVTVVQPEQPIQPEPDTKTTCHISVRCDTVLSNMQKLDESKWSLIPENGIIYENPNAVFYEGESVFNVLVRELKINNIHFEYNKTPMYNSVYIEGIGNLYEFDCGDLSGWLYRVNGISPGTGCSQYILSHKDVVEFIYSCNMGKDVGMYKAVSGG